MFDGCGRVDALNSETYQILMQLKPELFVATGKAPVPAGNQVSTSQSKSTGKLSDMLEAMLVGAFWVCHLRVHQGWEVLTLRCLTHQGWGITHNPWCHLNPYFKHPIQSSHIIKHCE